MNGLSKYFDDDLKIDHTAPPICAPPQLGSTSMPRLSRYQRHNASASSALKKMPPIPVIFSICYSKKGMRAFSGDCKSAINAAAPISPFHKLFERATSPS